MEWNNTLTFLPDPDFSVILQDQKALALCETSPITSVFSTEDVLFSGVRLEACYTPVRLAFKNPGQNPKDATDACFSGSQMC